MKNRLMKAARILVWAAAGLVAASSVQAQAFPSKPLKIVVPYNAGSGTDLVTRIVSEGLSEQFKQPVIVENVAGAGGVVGTLAIKREPADGYTLLCVTNSHLINGLLPKIQLYDAMKDYTAVARVSFNPLTLVVGGQSQFKTFKDLIDHMKANPGKVSFATSGRGAQSHLEVEFIKSVFNVKAVDIPYKSTATAITDTITGTVAFYMSGFASLFPNITTGRLRALAVGSQQRVPEAPDLPTFLEVTGVPNYLPASWFGFVVVSDTPPAVVSALEQGILRAVATPATRDRFVKIKSIPWVQNSREFGADMRAESVKWEKLINDLNLKVD